MPEAESGVERLSEEVLADAQRKADRRRRAAGREADKIVETARAEAEREADRLLQQAQHRADRHRQLILATVDQEINRRRLIRHAALLEGVIQAAFDRAAGKEGYDRRQVLADLAVAAIGQMEAPAFSLQVGAADREVLDEGFLAEVGRRLAQDQREAPELTVQDEPAPIAGGVIVRAADGTQMVDNSFEARRRRLAPDLRQMLAEMVFPDHGGGV